MITTLNNIKVGDRAIVRKIESSGGLKRRLLDIGLIDGTVIECILRSPGGDPRAYLIRGAVIAIRNIDSKDIFVEYIE